MKRLFFIFLSLVSVMTLHAQSFESAAQAVHNMGLGWNLGNALEANNQTYYDPAQDSYWGQQNLSSETCWGQSATKPELIAMMKEAGFTAIRVPVTWYNHMDANGNIDAQWMTRVHEVVDYVIDNGLYCILNVHHDTGADSQTSTRWLHASGANYNSYKSRYEHLWRQIAEEFKDYGQRLVFESFNEMLDKYNSWCFASFASPDKYNATDAADAYKAINSYAQSFVNVVRASGGNNATRNLIVNTYGACCGQGTWNNHLKDPLRYLSLPTDKVDGHLAVEVHDYPNIEGSLESVKAECNDMFAALNTYFLSKGMPVIIGEWGTSNVDKGDGKTDYDRYRSKMLQFADYFVTKAKSLGIATFYWMGLSDGIYRSFPAFNQPDLAEQLAKSYHGDDFAGKYPTLKDAEEITLWDGSKKLEWGTAVTIPASVFTEENSSKYLEITYKQDYTDYDDIQFFYGDWSSKTSSFTVGGKSFTTDFGPSNYYGTKSGTTHTTTIKFSAADYHNFSSKGLIIQGHGIILTKVRLVSSETSGIRNIRSARQTPDDNIYDLQGRKVDRIISPGIYIRNGRKFIE